MPTFSPISITSQKNYSNLVKKSFGATKRFQARLRLFSREIPSVDRYVNAQVKHASYKPIIMSISILFACGVHISDRLKEPAACFKG